MSSTWKCPKCGRTFAQDNQRHACGTGDRGEVLRNRADHLVELYEGVESFVQSLGEVEFVTRDRYVLLRTVRIFSDLVIMTDAVRIAIHLRRHVKHPLFFRAVPDGRKVTHVAKMRSKEDFAAIQPYLREAYELTVEPMDPTAPHREGNGPANARKSELASHAKAAKVKSHKPTTAKKRR